MSFTITIKGFEIKVDTADELSSLMDRFGNGGPAPGKPAPRKIEPSPTGAETVAMTTRVREMTREGILPKEIAASLGVSVKYVYQVRCKMKKTDPTKAGEA